MPHDTALIATIAAGIGLAFVFGFVAQRLKLPPIVGYLVAGIAVGPHSPGFVADASLASQLAEIGVILLMFGVGLHFSVGDLKAVRRVAVPGAIARIFLITALGAGLARLWGWPWHQGVVFGLALSIASTVVLLRVFEQRGMLDTMDGRIAVGWMIVEDLVMVVALVLLPALARFVGVGPRGAAGGPSLGVELALTLAQVIAFLVVMLIVGRRFVPWLLERAAQTGSRELFTLAVLAIALGIAVGAAALFKVSFALGAFFAGLVINESDLSHQAAADAVPLQDAFAVLFFVSVGMLVDPRVVMEMPLALLAVVLLVTLGKALAGFGLVVLLRYPVRTALVIGASLGQIGEFSFIVSGLGVTLGLLTTEGHSLVLAGALVSITLNPLMVSTIEPLDRWLRARPSLRDALERGSGVPAAPVQDRPLLENHAIVVGYGRVGSTVGRALEAHNIPFVIIERDRWTVQALRARGVPALYGDATRPAILAIARPEQARLVVVTTPDPFQARQVLQATRRLNPAIDTVVRTHSPAEQAYLETQNVGRVILGERELALGMAYYALRALGESDDTADVTLAKIRNGTAASVQ